MKRDEKEDQKKTHVEISILEIKENVRMAKVTFEKSQSITYERYMLFKRSHEVGESLEAFHAALTVQAAKSALDIMDDEIVRDLFISKMRSTALQDTLMFETLPPDERLKRALKFEQSKQTTQAFQKSTLGTAQTISQSGSQIKIKQEPTVAVGNINQQNKRYNRDRSRQKQPDGRAPAKYNTDDRKSCNRCGKLFTEGHLKNCAAM